jgi:hypothetical protein
VGAVFQKSTTKEGGLHTEADFGHSNSCSVPVRFAVGGENQTYLSRIPKLESILGLTLLFAATCTENFQLRRSWISTA